MIAPNRLGRVALLLGLSAFPAFCGDWNPKLAAEYMDGRQKEWFAWKPASRPGGPCISCHTGVVYLFARPALRARLGESKPTEYEAGLVNALRARNTNPPEKEVAHALKNDPAASQSLGVEAVLAALFLARESGPNAPLNADAKQAFDRLWALSIREGEPAGAWSWFNLTLDPWEMPDSRFYGATLAAMAVGSAPPSYVNQPEIAERVKALTAYLHREEQNQPLHNRLMLAWASTKLPAVSSAAARTKMINELWSKQDADGGWSIQALGPWKDHADAPASNGSNAYATALTAFVLQEAGVPKSNPKLAKALDWLRAHQDKQSGFWTADSMNKKYPADSMPLLFMRDAATAYAVLALVDRPRISSGGRAE